MNDIKTQQGVDEQSSSSKHSKPYDPPHLVRLLSTAPQNKTAPGTQENFITSYSVAPS